MENYLIHRTQVNIIVQLTKLLDSLLNDPLAFTSDVIHAIFLQAFIWSIGACLKQEDRVTIDAFIKYLSGLSTSSGQLPSEKPLLFDHIFRPELNRWITWEDLIPNYEHDRSKRFSEIFVPTVDTIRLGRLKKSSPRSNFCSVRMVNSIDGQHSSTGFDCW